MSEARRLEKEVVLAATPEQVWEAIATGPGVASWFMPMDIEAGVGGAVSLGGTVTAWEPGRRLEVRAGGPDGDSAQAFEYLIEARDGGSTVLRFVQTGFQGEGWEAEYEAMSRGWDMYFHTLDQYLTHFPGRTAAYVDAEAPAESAGERGWAVVMAGLGLPGAAAAGDRVRLAPDGLEPIEGVVDYLTPAHTSPTFLGLRTADAMYRLHGRAGMGMPVAVGHHLFAAGVDVDRVRKAWQAWLEGLFPASA